MGSRRCRDRIRTDPVERTPTARTSGGCHGGSEYTADELEYIQAVVAWQKKHGVRYPAFSDFLRIALQLGYRKVEPAGPVHAERGESCRSLPT